MFTLAAMEVADDELRVNGRDSAHKVTVLITTAGWTNIGDNPYENVNKLKNLGEKINFKCLTLRKPLY